MHEPCVLEFLDLAGDQRRMHSQLLGEIRRTQTVTVANN